MGSGLVVGLGDIVLMRLALRDFEIVGAEILGRGVTLRGVLVKLQGGFP